MANPLLFGFLIEGAADQFNDLSNQQDLVEALLARCLNVPNVGATDNLQPQTQFFVTPTEAVSIVVNGASGAIGVILEGF